jgi:hypothetical protein
MDVAARVLLPMFNNNLYNPSVSDGILHGTGLAREGAVQRLLCRAVDETVGKHETVHSTRAGGVFHIFPEGELL